jgi:hypothetical protein
MIIRKEEYCCYYAILIIEKHRMRGENTSRRDQQLPDTLTKQLSLPRLSQAHRAKMHKLEESQTRQEENLSSIKRKLEELSNRIHRRNPANRNSSTNLNLDSIQEHPPKLGNYMKQKRSRNQENSMRTPR